MNLSTSPGAPPATGAAECVKRPLSQAKKRWKRFGLASAVTGATGAAVGAGTGACAGALVAVATAVGRFRKPGVTLVNIGNPPNPNQNFPRRLSAVNRLLMVKDSLSLSQA